MPTHFADRVTAAAQAKGTPAIVGIDPVYDKLPAEIIASHPIADPTCAADAIFEYCTRIIRVVAPLVPVVKLNIAFFETHHAQGLENYFSLIHEATEQGLEVIGDIKRGDIGSTAQAYATAHLSNNAFAAGDGLATPSAVTVNAFAGADGINHFATTACENGKGIFVWVRASNPSAATLQEFVSTDGTMWYEHLAAGVAELANQPEYLGSTGLSDIGMVIGGTTTDQATELRRKYPHIIYLVPGYGAQGASAADCVRLCRADGSGALISASRSIIYAFGNPRYQQRFGDDWEKCVEQACLDMKADLAAALDAR